MSNFNLTITDKNGRVHRPLVRGIRFARKYIGGIDDWLTFYLDRRLNRDWEDISYDNKVILCYGITSIWQGRIRQIAEDQSGKESLFILALGYIHYFKDYPYGDKGKLWIDTRLDRLKPVTSDDWSRALDTSYNFTISGKDGLVYIAPKNLSYSSQNEIGAVTYWSYIDTIKRLEFDYELVIPDDPWGIRVGNLGTWSFGLFSFNIDWTGITEEQLWYDDISGHADITLSPARERIAFGLYYNRDNTPDLDIGQFVEYPGAPVDPLPISQSDMETDDWIDVVKANDTFDRVEITMGTNKNVSGGELRAQYLSERWAGGGYGWVNLPIFRDGTTSDEGTTNLVNNGDMEETSGWNDYNSPTVNERSTEQVYEGSYSRKFTAPGNWQGIQNNGNPWTSVTGQGYTLRFVVYPDDDTSVRIRVRKGDNSGFLFEEEFTGLAQDTWQLIEKNYVETAGGAVAYIVFESGTAGAGTWYIDDVNVVTASAPFSQDGNIDFDSPPVDWTARTPGLAKDNNYWIRLRPTEDLDSIDIDDMKVNLGVRRVVEDTIYAKITNLKIYGENNVAITAKDVFLDIVSQLSGESRCDINSSTDLVDPNDILTKVQSQLVFERGETCYQAAEELQTIGDENNRPIAWGVEKAGDRVFLHPLSDAATEPWRSYKVRYIIFPEEAERLQIEGQVQDIVTYAYGRYEDIDGIEKLTAGYVAYVDESLGTYGLRAALLTPPVGKKSAEEFFNIKRVKVIMCGRTVLTGAQELVKSALINQGRPKLRSSVATKGRIIDRKMGTKMIPAFWMEPGYLIQIARFRAVDAEGASGDILDDWATTFLLAGIEYDCETGTCTLIPMEPELTSSRLLSR